MSMLGTNCQLHIYWSKDHDIKKMSPMQNTSHVLFRSMCSLIWASREYKGEATEKPF